MLRKGQEGHVRAEKDLLAAAATASDATSRWIVKLHYSFQVRPLVSLNRSCMHAHATESKQDVDRLYLVSAPQA
jgi:hypothetical protein